MSSAIERAPQLALNATLYDLLMTAAGALYTAMAAERRRLLFEPPPLLLQLRSGLAESPGWFLLQTAEFDPQPLTAQGLRVRDVYASERIVVALLELMAGEGWLERQAEGAYALAPAGRALLETTLACRRQALGAVSLLPEDQASQLRDLLTRIVEASLAAPDPPGAWCLRYSRRRAPPADMPAHVQLLQLFEDLNAFRDDAHMAAWRLFGVQGYEWEAFAVACERAAATGAELAHTLAHRGYSGSEYTGALAALAERGWLERAANGAYHVTSKGRALRSQAELATDAAFYAPWATLNPSELVQLQNLVAQLANHAGAG